MALKPGSKAPASGQYGVWDACRDAVAYDNSGGFDEINGQFNGKILADPAHNGWTKDQEVLDFLDNLSTKRLHHLLDFC